MTQETNVEKKILIEARKLIDTPKKWTQGAYARNAYGANVFTSNSKATCFCGRGAIFVAAAEMGASPNNSIRLLEKAVETNFIIWQDKPERTHAEVLYAFNKAILLADQEN